MDNGAVFAGHRADAEQIRMDLLSARAVTAKADRAAVYDGDSPVELREFLEKVRHASYKITEDDIRTLHDRRVSDDVIFELTVAATVSTAIGRFQAAQRALRGHA